ncbi:MAG: hypothetical protein ACO1O1_11140 [Adhaeribacter sp.]
MKIRIVCYEDVDAWILGKFARRLQQEIAGLNFQVDIAKVPDPGADINHHIIYFGFEQKVSPVETLMVTHIDDIRKLNLVRGQLRQADAGICMSESTMIELVASGIPRNKLCYVNPAHDGVMKPRKFKVGITSKVQPDGCKRESMLVKLSQHISSDDFEFIIMGAGWEEVIGKLEARGFKVTYYNAFDHATYLTMVPALDYYLYMGMDEGSMGFMDALAAGVKTIVTTQGYHLDADQGITHPFQTQEELIEVFTSISADRQRRIDSISSWNWKDYALKHLEIWSYLLDRAKNAGSSLEVQGAYKDGLNSFFQTNHQELIRQSKVNYKAKLIKGALNRTIYKIGKVKDFETFKEKIGKKLF